MGSCGSPLPQGTSICNDRTISKPVHSLLNGICCFLKKTIYLFLESGEGEGEREGEKHQCVVASCTPPTGGWPTTQAGALAGNWPSNPLVHRPTPNPLSHTSWGSALCNSVLGTSFWVSGYISIGLRGFCGHVLTHHMNCYNIFNSPFGWTLVYFQLFAVTKVINFNVR